MALTVDSAFVTQELREIWRCCWALGYCRGGADAYEKDVMDKAIEEISNRADVLHAAVDPEGRTACRGIVDEIDEEIAA